MGLLSRIFGIDDVLSEIKGLEKKLQPEVKDMTKSCKSVDFISPMDNSTFLRIESTDNIVFEITSNAKAIGKADKVLGFIQYLPFAQNAMQSKMLEGAYKIVMPEGAVGQLMKYKNGMLGTPLVQPNGHIGNAHAGLVSIQNMSLTPLMVFTALSAITGQYFMAKINKSLEMISKDVKEIIYMLLDDKEARNKAVIDFYSYVRDNLDLVANNPDLRIATLTNLQSFLVDLKQNQIFYEKTIKRQNSKLNDVLKEKYTSDRISMVNEIQNEISTLLVQQHICLELYVIGKMYEMQIAQIYDKDYCIKLVNEFESNVVNAVDFCQNIISEHSDIINLIKSKAVINFNMIDKQENSLKLNFVDRIETFENNSREAISSIKDVIELNFGQQVFYIQQGELYYLQNNAS